jgi:hypothetical protein
MTLHCLRRRRLRRTSSHGRATHDIHAVSDGLLRAISAMTCGAAHANHHNNERGMRPFRGLRQKGRLQGVSSTTGAAAFR